MSDIVTATLVVQYADPDADEEGKSIIKAEFDSEKNTSQPASGVPVYYKIYANCSYQIKVTAGANGLDGSGVDDKEDQITFTGSPDASLGYPFNGGWNWTWYGTQFGIASGPSVPNSAGEIKVVPDDVVKPRCFGIGLAKYKSNFSRYKLTWSGTPPFAILIIIEEIPTP